MRPAVLLDTLQDVVGSPIFETRLSRAKLPEGVYTRCYGARTWCPCTVAASLGTSELARPAEYMATTTRTRAMPGRGSAGKRPSRTPLSRRVAAIYGTARAALPEIAGTPRFRELLGVLLVPSPAERM